VTPGPSIGFEEAGAATGGKVRLRMRQLRLRGDERIGYLILLPVFALVAIIVYIPGIVTLWRSFNSVSFELDSKPQFVGLTNYIRLLTPGSEFWGSTSITLKVILMTLPLELLIGMGGALVLNESFRSRGVVRTLAVLPWMLPPLVNGFMWNWLLNGDYGALNGFLYQIHAISNYHYWLGTPRGQLFWVAVAQAWTRYSFVMLVVLAGLQAIPDDLYEAARLDGAGGVASFVHITLPLLIPAFTVTIAVELITSLQVFDLVWSITAGGGAGGQINPFTKVLMVLNYQVVFRNLQIGAGAALAYLILLLSIGAALFFVRNLYRRVSL
jgi:ABC-type sugar transport system permease subunit